MTEPTNTLPAARPRKALTQIAPVSWEHPADRAALQSLRSIPGFDEIVKKISGFIGERGFRLLFQADAVRVGPKQFPRLNELYTQYARAHSATVSVVDFAAAVCPGGPPCPRTVDGIEPRPLDGMHFTPQTATWGSRPLLDAVLACRPAASGWLCPEQASAGTGNSPSGSRSMRDGMAPRLDYTCRLEKQNCSPHGRLHARQRTAPLSRPQ